MLFKVFSTHTHNCEKNSWFMLQKYFKFSFRNIRYSLVLNSKIEMTIPED